NPMKIQRVCGGRRREHAASQAAALRCLGAGRTGRRRTQRAMGVRREARWDHTMVGPEERIERVVEKHAACRHVERSLLDDGLHRRMGKYMRRRSRELKIEAGSGVGYRCARREAERIVWRRGGYGGRCMPIRKSITKQKVEPAWDTTIDGKAEIDSVQSEIRNGLRARGQVGHKVVVRV